MVNVVLCGLYLWLNLYRLDLLGWTVSVGNIWLTLWAIYTIASFQIVGPDQVAVVLRFGKIIIQVDSGLALVPLVVCTLKKINRTTYQVEIPGPPEKVFNEDRKTDLGPGEVRPVRITTAGPELCSFGDWVPWMPFYVDDPSNPSNAEARAKAAYETRMRGDETSHLAEKALFVEDLRNASKGKDPLHQRLTIEPSAFFRFRISDPKSFIRNIGRLEGEGGLIGQISDAVVARLQSEFRMRTTALIIAQLPMIKRVLRREVEVLIGEIEDPRTGRKRAAPWGIDLRDVEIKLVGITESVNKQIAARTAAQFEREAEIEKGRGRGGAAEAELTGRAKGLKRIADATKTEAGRLALQMQTTKDTFEKTEKVVVVGGSNPLSDLLGTVVGAKEALAGGRKTKRPDSETTAE